MSRQKPSIFNASCDVNYQLISESYDRIFLAQGMAAVREKAGNQLFLNAVMDIPAGPLCRRHSSTPNCRCCSLGVAHLSFIAQQDNY
jgi:hypothetical protein